MRSQGSGSHRPRESGCLRHGAGRTGVARSDCGWPSTDQTVVFLRFLTISLSGRLRVLFRLVVFFLRAVVLLAVVRFRDVPLRFRVAAAFFAARDLAADFRFRVAATFFAEALLFAEALRFRALIFLAVVFLRAGAILRLADFLDAELFLRRAVAMWFPLVAQDRGQYAIKKGLGQRRRKQSVLPLTQPRRTVRLGTIGRTSPSHHSCFWRLRLCRELHPPGRAGSNQMSLPSNPPSRFPRPRRSARAVVAPAATARPRFSKESFRARSSASSARRASKRSFSIPPPPADSLGVG